MSKSPDLRGGECKQTIALFHWGDLIEDFLDSIGVTFESFTNEMTGGWMFGYIDALSMRGIRTVLFCVSARIDGPADFAHVPTGAVICVLPASRTYRLLRRRIRNPYGWTLEDCVGEVSGLRRWSLAIAKDLLPYFATPLRTLRREMRRLGCEKILCQEYEYARFDACVLLGRMMKVKVFATFQGGTWQTSRLERFIRPLSMRWCSGLVVGAGKELDRVRTVYPMALGKVTQIYNPLDPTLYESADRGTARARMHIEGTTLVVMWHGRVDLYRKGLDVLINAWEQVCQSRADVDLRLLLLGTGTDAGQLKQRLSSRKLSNVLWKNEYVHDRATIAEYLCAADVYVCPSRHEGFPVAPLEAMASGLPVIVSDAPGMSDILEHGATSGGLIVPRDDPNALASAVLQLIDDAALRARLGASARRRIRKDFSLAAVGSKLEHFLSV